MRITKLLLYAILIAALAGTASCSKKKKKFFFLPGMFDSSPAVTQTVAIGDQSNGNSGQVGGLELTFPDSFDPQDDPEGAYDGTLIAGNDGDTYGSGSNVPGAGAVDSLMDRILAAIAGWDKVDENGYSLISRQDVSNAPIPTETASLQIRTGDAATADAIRNALVILIGSVDGSGNVSQFPPEGGTSSVTVFRIVVQASEDHNGNAAVLFGVTTADNYDNVESDLAGLVDGTNIGPGDAQTYVVNDQLFAAAPPKADFLMVIDNSGSMSQEQAAVKANSIGFFYRLAQLGLDFQVATVTTDSSAVRGSGFTNDRSQFESDVDAGIKGSGTESCTYYAEKALSTSDTNNQNADLTQGKGSRGSLVASLREDVPLSVICLTDESDAYSKLDKSGSNTDAPRFSLTDNLFTAKGYTYYAIMPLDASGNHGSCVGVNGNANVHYNFNTSQIGTAALRMDTLARNTSGSVSSICGENYGAFMKQIADRAATGASVYQLSRVPVSATIQVYLNGVAIPATVSPQSGSTGFVYQPSSNKIAFTGTIPAFGTPVEIVYKSYQAE